VNIQTSVKAIFFDFGGVITDSPFEAFNQFEKKNKVPLDFIRKVNSINPNANAWAQFERNQISLEQFDQLFSCESEKLGYRIAGKKIIQLLNGCIRPQMVSLVKRCKKKYITACLTNNIKPSNLTSSASEFDNHKKIHQVFHHVIESSKIGVRKPEPAFYQYACNEVGVKPTSVIFLDDLGINLKPARAMGMITIKVKNAEQAIKDIEKLINI